MVTKKKSSKKDACFWIFKLIEKFVDSMRKVLSLKLFEFLKRWLLTLGNCGFYVASGLALLIGIIAAIRMESFGVFATAIGFAVGFFILQYVAIRFAKAGDKLIENNETSLSSSAFLDSVALLSMIGGALIFLYYIYFAIKVGNIGPFIIGLGAFIFFELIAILSLNPKSITVNVVSETSAGQEAIGIMTFFMKTVMKLVPILFGLGVIIGTFMMLIHSFGLFKEGLGMSIAWANVNSDMSMVALAALLPFLAYIAFVFVFLIIDIYRAILAIPQKLDNLGKK
ncbi:MAG: hypothetical protein ABFR75_04090 [Acidobacteriota bacterium]